MVLCFLAIGLAAICIGVALVGCVWLNAISRNPEAADKLQSPALIIIGSLELPLLMKLFFIYMFLG